MSLSDKVWFISSGMDRPKKRDHILSRRQQYLNYGALTLATILKQSGYNVRLFHGGHSDAAQFANEMVDKGMLSSKFPVFLSIPSFYALSWSQGFTEKLKQLSPSTSIIVGGRWVVGSDVDWLKSRLPFVDEIVPGLAEGKILSAVSINNNVIASAGSSTGVPKFNLDHTLVDGYQEYQPSVEASRGCGMGCAFCEERDIPLSRLKDPVELVRHLQEVAEQYDDWSVRPYVQSSFFAPNRSWSEKMAREVSRYGNVVKWRCETRVDSIKPSSIAALADAGLKVVDLGLESASIQQLIKMGKSDKPEQYLRAASDLIEACSLNGIWVKVNFLLYAGETMETYHESLRWLDAHKDFIKGVSVGPVVVFGSPSTSKNFIEDIYSQGGRLVDSSSNSVDGIGRIHPSDGISAEYAECLSLETSRRYMTKDDYYDLKSFSYYPRSYSRNDFEDDVQNGDASKLPFV